MPRMSHWNGVETEGRSKTYRWGRSIKSGVVLIEQESESLGCAVGSLGIVLSRRRCELDTMRQCATMRDNARNTPRLVLRFPQHTLWPNIDILIVRLG